MGTLAVCDAIADRQLCAAQSVYIHVPLCGTRLAASAGTAHISREGITPLAWLSRFGRSVNRGVAGDPDTPLPLHGPEPFTHRWAAPPAAAQMRWRSCSRLSTKCSLPES